MAKLTKDAFIKALKEMSLLEIKELVDGMKEEFGIDPTAVATATPADSNPTTESSEVDVIITADGGAKVAVIKAVREITSAGLMDAKKAVESLPYTIKEQVSAAEAEEIANKLKEAGATVEIK